MGVNTKEHLVVSSNLPAPKESANPSRNSRNLQFHFYLSSLITNPHVNASYISMKIRFRKLSPVKSYSLSSTSSLFFSSQFLLGFAILLGGVIRRRQDGLFSLCLSHPIKEPDRGVPIHIHLTSSSTSIEPCSNLRWSF